jgi:hypothetical protein
MKHLIWYTSFIALLFAGDRVGGIFLHDQVMHSQFRYSQLYSRLAAADIMLLGNSRGLTFYQTCIQ